MLTTISSNTQPVSDNRGSDRLDLLLYGSPDPNKNRATRRARTLAPDEMRSKGYQDGINNRGMLGSACTNPNYLQGYNEGYSARPSAA
jgi:hypothetical protein